MVSGSNFSKSLLSKEKIAVSDIWYHTFSHYMSIKGKLSMVSTSLLIASEYLPSKRKLDQKVYKVVYISKPIFRKSERNQNWYAVMDVL